jgi:hypothetical protein
MKRGIYYHSYLIWHFHFLCFEINCVGGVSVISRMSDNYISLHIVLGRTMQCRYSNHQLLQAAFGFNETRIGQVNFTSIKCLNVATVKNET